MYSEHASEVATLQETIQIIDTALSAEDFNEGDRAIVERNRDFFKDRLDSILKLSGHSIKSAQLVA